MFLINFFRFFTGYVRFKASGGFGERFLNLCAQNNITLWDVAADGNEICASTSVSGYRKIRSAARKSGMTARMIKKSGLPFIAHKYKKRTGIPVGIAVFMLSISILSTRIWLVKIEGNTSIPEETVIDALSQSGLNIGCSLRSADPVRIALNAGRKIEGISELSVNISGSCASVKIKEREVGPEIQEKDGMYNLVASKDAQLVVLEPYSGTVRAKILNTVLKDEILIDGIVANKDETTGYVHAAGYAVGRTEEIIKSEVDENEKFSAVENLGKRYALFIFGKEILPVKSGEDCDFILKKEKYLSLSDKKMPFGIFCTDYSSINHSKINPSEKQKEQICIERYMQKMKDYTQTRQIISEKFQSDFSSGKKLLTGTVTCYENIGIEREFSIEEGSP